MYVNFAQGYFIPGNHTQENLSAHGSGVLQHGIVGAIEKGQSPGRGKQKIVKIAT